MTEQSQKPKRSRGRPRRSATAKADSGPKRLPCGYYCEVDPEHQRGRLVRVPEAVVICPLCGGTAGAKVVVTRARFDAGVIERYRECAKCRRTFVTYEPNA